MPMFKYHYIALSCVALSLLSLFTICSRKQQYVAPKFPVLGKKISTSRNLGKKSDNSLNDIRVPMDMWRQPSISWQPPELPTCCAQWSLVTHRFKRSRKFSVSCAPEKDGLRYYGPGTGLTPSDLRTAMRDIGGDFVLIGDSVTRQWFETLSCYLGAWESWKGYAKKPLEENYDVLEADITRTLLDFSERFRERGDLGFIFKNKDAVGFGAFQIPTSSEREIIQNVIVHNDCTLTIEETADLIIYYTNVYRRKFKRGKATIIINRGLHYNKNDRIENENKLRDDLRILMRVCADRNARCIFRESSPQHFTTSAGDGLFIEWNGELCMKDPPATFQTLDRWRNDMLYDVVKEVLSRTTLRSRNDGFVRVMPLFDRLSGLNHAHKGNEDCSHFYSDAEYWEPWHLSLTQVLTDIANTMNDVPLLYNGWVPRVKITPAGSESGSEETGITTTTLNDLYADWLRERETKKSKGETPDPCSVDFLPFPHSEEDEQARKQFVDAIDPKKELGDILIFSRYRYHRRYNRGKTPIMFDFFDQLILDKGKSLEPKDSPNPRSIYCGANHSRTRIKNCMKKIMQLPALGEPESGYLTKRILMVGNADGPRLSVVLKQFQQLFDHKKISLVLSESKDERLPKGTQITSVPFGFDKWYVDTIYGEQVLRDAILQASLQNKSKGVLAAWGAKWKGLDTILQSRKEATEFTDKSCLAPRQMIAGKDYIGTLSQYRFLLAPTGSGISTPKVAEALSVLTIPIVQRVPDGGYWDDLKELYGWPLAIVDKWDEITPENLQKWWVELAPQLNRARHNLLADRWWYQINHLDL